jgi:protein TonB
MPTFNGGDPATEFRKYIAQNLRYPEIAAENGISGRVIVQFAVNKMGSVVDAIVVRSVDPALDKEAIRVVMSSPKWTPGKQRGKAVKVLFTFPINFVLQ